MNPINDEKDSRIMEEQWKNRPQRSVFLPI